MMAFAGHNKGKKFVPGVGYVMPDQPPRKPHPRPVCYVCRNVIIEGDPMLTRTKKGFTVTNPGVETLHAKCDK